MENSSLICSICCLKYDTQTRKPVSLLQCTHTICQDCANSILRSGSPPSCPFDRKPFPSDGKGKYVQPQVNGLALSLLDSNSFEECPKHSRNLEYYCVTDYQPVCSDCLVFENHINHKLDSLQNIQKKLKEKQESLNSCKTALETYQSDINTLLQKRRFEQLEELDKFYDDQERIVKRHRKDLKFMISVGYQQQQKRLEDFFQNNSSLQCIRKAKIEDYKSIKCPTKDQLVDNEFEGVIAQFDKKELINGFCHFDIDLKSEFQKILEASCHGFPAINLAELVSKEERKDLVPHRLYGSLCLSLNSYTRMKYHFSLEKKDETLYVTINHEISEESLANLESFQTIKAIHIDLQSVWLDDDDLMSLDHMLRNFKQAQSLTLLCKYLFKGSISLTKSFSTRFFELLSAIFGELKNLARIDIVWLKEDSKENTLEALITNILPQGLKLKHFGIEIRNSKPSLGLLQFLFGRLKQFEQSIESLKIVIEGFQCSAWTCPTLNMSNLKSLHLELCSPCCETIRTTLVNVMVTLLTPMTLLQDLTFGCILKDSVRSEPLVKISSVIRGMSVLKNLKVSITEILDKITDREIPFLLCKFSNVILALKSLQHISFSLTGTLTKATYELKTQEEILKYYSK